MHVHTRTNTHMHAHTLNYSSEQQNAETHQSARTTQTPPMRLRQVPPSSAHTHTHLMQLLTQKYIIMVLLGRRPTADADAAAGAEEWRSCSAGGPCSRSQAPPTQRFNGA